MRLRHACAAVAAALLLAACSSVEYQDTNAEVDRRPECVGQGDRPGEPVAPWCEREQSASWSTESKSEPIDFGNKDD